MGFSDPGYRSALPDAPLLYDLPDKHLQWFPDGRCCAPLGRNGAVLCPADAHYLEHQEGNAGLQILTVMKKSSLLYKIINGIWDMCYIWKTEMRNVFRDEGVLIFCILVPLGYPLLYSWIYNNEVVREVDTAIVDLSHSHSSREFIRDYDASPDAKATYYCNSLDEAKELVRRQAVHGILYFPADFDTKLNRGEQAHVGVYCDMSLMLTYKAIYQTSQAVASHINSGIQITQAGGFTDRDDEITTEPLAFDEVPIFNTTGGYGNAILPAVLVLILQQTMLLGIGMAAGTSRELNRNRELIPVSEHYGGIFRIVFGKCDFLVHRNAAELAEQHLRQRESVFCLSNLHLSLVHFHVYLQSVCLGGYSLLNHLVNILVQFLYEVAVTDGEFLLLLQRNGEPVSLVYAVERALGLLVEIILCNLLSDVGNLVGCNDGSTHIDRLANHHTSCPDIAGVGAESIYQFLSQRIALNWLWVICR
jgi:hypothetical protein